MPKAKFSPAYTRLRKLLVLARHVAGLKQADVAKRLGRHQSYVSKVEAGERRLDVVEFLEFAAAIDTDPVLIVRKISKVRPR